MRSELGSPFSAPDHYISSLVQLLATRVARRRPDAPEMSPNEQIAEVQRLAQQHGDRMWSQAFAAGATYAIELAAHPRVVVQVDEAAAATVAEMLDPIRYSVRDRRHRPMPTSVIRPEEYRPDHCPRCGGGVEDTLVVYLALPDGSSGPDSQVLLKPCHHSIDFIDDTDALRKANDDAC